MVKKGGYVCFYKGTRYTEKMCVWGGGGEEENIIDEPKPLVLSHLERV